MKVGQVVAVIDIGSTKVSCCIASVSDDENFDILGMGYCACLGVESGIIVDMNSVCRSIAVAVESAEKIANLRIKSAYVNVSGRFVKSRIVNVSANIGGRIIKQQDIEKLACREYNCDYGYETEVIHSIPILFELDSLTCTFDPVGMFANTLKASINVVTVPKAQLNNIIVSLLRCHLDVAGVVYSGYASGLCVLNDELNQENHTVIDFGGGGTTINFFYKGAFCGAEFVPLGGQNITKDLSYGMNVSYSNAERLKTLHGAAFVSSDDKKSLILVPTQEERDIINLQQIPRSEVNEIIQPRVEEILKMVKEKIDNSIFKSDFSPDLIITGGGSMLTGIRDFASEILKKPVNEKKMEDFSEQFDLKIGNDFSVTIGMIKFAMLSAGGAVNQQNDDDEKGSYGFLKKAINWLENNL